MPSLQNYRYNMYSTARLPTHYDTVVVRHCPDDHRLSDVFGRKASPVGERDTFPL